MKTDDMRDAYLELLKQTLTDYIHIEDRHANAMPFGFESHIKPFRKFKRNLLIKYMAKRGRGIVKYDTRTLEQRRADREGGIDWPVIADSMIGLKRMDNLKELIAKIAADKVPGDVIETGVWRGGASIFMRACMRAYGLDRRKLWVCDSFEGLPPPDMEKYPQDEGDELYKEDFLRVSQEQVANNFRRYGLLDDKIEFVKGFFEDTLATVPAKKFSLLRLDGDMYSSTMVALEELYPKLSKGGFIIIDDYNALQTCKQATHDYRDRHGITDKIIEIDTIGAYWRKS